MPIPHELLHAAIETLSPDTIVRMGRHGGLKVPLPPDKVIEWLASDDGSHLLSYSSYLAVEELAPICDVFGVSASGVQTEMASAVWFFIHSYDYRAARDELHRKLGVPPLDPDLFFEEVLAMTRGCIHLTGDPGDGPFAGIWGGPGIVPTTLPSHEHLITIDTAHLPFEFEGLGLRGAVSVYVDQESDVPGNFGDGGCVENDPLCKFGVRSKKITSGRRIIFTPENSDPATDGQPLYARHGLSYPSVYHVLNSPPPKIRKWLQAMGHTFEPEGCDSIPVKELREVYDAVIRPLDPHLVDDGIAAVCGGWEIYQEYSYVDGIGDDRQLLFTLWEAEPWIQAVVRKNSGEFAVRQIIT